MLSRCALEEYFADNTNTHALHNFSGGQQNIVYQKTANSYLCEHFWTRHLLPAEVAHLDVVHGHVNVKVLPDWDLFQPWTSKAKDCALR
jgi:hypothetical protein